MTEKTDGELVLECIEALCDLSIQAARLARIAYDGAAELTESLHEATP